MLRARGRIAPAAVVLAMAASPATPQLVTSYTLCAPTLPSVLPSPTGFFEPHGQRPQLNGDGAIRFEAEGGRTGLGLYRFVDSERVSGQFPIRFGLFLDGKGGVVVREHEKIDKKVGDYEAGDVLEIAIIGGSARYIKNGETLYVSAQGPRFPFDPAACGDAPPNFVMSKEWTNQHYRNEAPVPVARASRSVSMPAGRMTPTAASCGSWMTSWRRRKRRST